MSQTFSEWSENWKSLKSRKGNPEDIVDVIKQWKRLPPSQALGRVFPKHTGFRKHTATLKGEQEIESRLLGLQNGKPPIHEISGASVSNLAVCAIFHNFAVAKLSGQSTKGQVIADAFGVLRIGKKYHPLSIEVKKTDGNCWRAVVQNLQQVRFLRFWGVDLRRSLASRSADFVPSGTPLGGAWGMVLAPPDYWQEKKLFTQAKALLERLPKANRARVLLASINKDGEIWMVGGHKFVANGSK